MAKSFVIALVVMICVWPGWAQQGAQVSVTGFLTDTACGKRGANEKHIECAKRSVASGRAKYALYDEKTRQLYILDPQDTAVAYLGQRVTITGTLSPSALRSAGQAIDPKTGQAAPLRRALDSSTPIAGVLTISSITSPQPTPR